VVATPVSVEIGEVIDARLDATQVEVKATLVDSSKRVPSASAIFALTVVEPPAERDVTSIFNAPAVNPVPVPVPRK
jgi:hypothetical protein